MPGSAADHSRPRCHRHGLLTIRLAILLVIDIRLSWPAAAAALALFAPSFSGTTPAFSTLRRWLLRLGLYMLRQAGGIVAGGWTLLIDHTAAHGSRKLFVVLGVPTQDLPRCGYAPGHRDITALAVQAMDTTTGLEVAKVLRPVLRRIGALTQVVSDGASELTDAVGRLQADCPELIWTYDVRHMLAAQLKRRLVNCQRWAEFLAECARVLPRVRQTAGNFLAPPVLRIKARYMNLDSHVAWAQRLLAWQEKGDWAVLGRLLGQDATAAQAWYCERLGWLGGFEADVRRWAEWLEVASLALAEVHEDGLSGQTAGRFWQRWRDPAVERTFCGEQMAREVKRALSQEGSKMAGKRGLGSSDVIESLLGRYKQMASRGPTGELTANVLLMALMAGEPVNNEQIKKGLESVGDEEVREWIEQQMGPSDQAKHRTLFGCSSPTQTLPLDDPLRA